MLCAPAGTAPHNINKTTHYSAFCIPVGKGFAYIPLDMHHLKIFRTKFISYISIYIRYFSFMKFQWLGTICSISSISDYKK